MKFKRQKKEDKKNKELCSQCNAECCKYVALEIDCPEKLKEFEDIKWYVAHKNINVYVDEDYVWHIEFSTPCEHLNLKTNNCKIYSRRPEICKDFSQEECPFHNEYEERYVFKKIKDVEKYIGDVFNKGKHKIPKD